MPELSRFLGMTIAMYFKDHNPPHFHVLYNEFDAEIIEDWKLIQSTGKFNKIQPLV